MVSFPLCMRRFGTLPLNNPEHPHSEARKPLVSLRLPSIPATMRLRFLWVDYYGEASQTAEKWLQGTVIPVPALQDSIFSFLSCRILVLTEVVPQILERNCHIANVDSSKLQHLNIERIQSQFLSIILPEKLVFFSIPRFTSTTGEVFEDIVLCLSGVGEAKPNNSFLDFECAALDTTYQNNAAMMSLSELSSIFGKKPRQDTKKWEVHSQPEYCKYSSLEEMILQSVKLPIRIEVDSQQKNNTGRQSSVNSELPLLSVAGNHGDLPLLNQLELKFPLLEVPTVDETSYPSRGQRISLAIKRMMTDLFSHVISQPILEPQCSKSSLNTYSLDSLVDDDNKVLVRSAELSLDTLWNLIDSRSSDEIFPCFMLELPVSLYETMGIQGFMQLFHELDLSHRIVPSLDSSESRYSKTFEDIIVMPELVVTDTDFMSLPVPTFERKKEERIAMEVMLEALPFCKHSVPGALNFLYLDWHYSENKDCRKDACTALDHKMFDVERFIRAKCDSPQFDHANIDSTTNIHLETRYPLEKELQILSPKKNHSLKTKCSVQRDSPLFTKHHSLETRCSVQGLSPVSKSKPDCSLESTESVCLLPLADESKMIERQCISGVPPSKAVNDVHIEATGKQPELGDLFACNDLSFFLQARQGSIKEPSSARNSVQRQNPGIVSVDESLSNFQVHDILLTEQILTLTGFLELDYCRILEGEESLTSQLYQHRLLRKLSVEADAKDALVMLIKEKANTQEIPNEQQLLRGLIALYILQQTAENLCMYGILVGHLYMESWYLNLRFLQDLICFSYSELEEAYRQVEKGLIMDHPKLKRLQKIIESHKCNSKNPKILIVVQRRAVFTIYKQIISCDLRPYQFDREESFFHGDNQLENVDLFEQAVSDALVKCDCLIVPPEYITPSFPIGQFTCIIQYEDLNDNKEDDIRSISNTRSLEIHAFRMLRKEHDCNVQNDKHPPCTAVKQNSSPMQQSGTISQRSVKGGISLQNGQTANVSILQQNMNEMDGFHPNVSDNFHSEAAMRCNENLNGYKQCDMNLVINVSQSFKHLLSSYKSSLQKILALEKDGVCVIERDLILPIDLILSPTVCLILYTLDKIHEGNLMSGEAVELPWMENIIHEVMKPLSFSFRTCVMIFEGTFKFVANALQGFGCLYAAAIGLDIELQCFISGGSFTTDLIIAECIRQVRISKKGVSYPRMMEAKTFAEAFLTEFASINPLTAHAILSSGTGISQFMSCSIEEQIRLTDLFHLSEKCLYLLKKQWQSGSTGRLSKVSRWRTKSKNIRTVDSSGEKTFLNEKLFDDRSNVWHRNQEMNEQPDFFDGLKEGSRIHKSQENYVAATSVHECELWPRGSGRGRCKTSDEIGAPPSNMGTFCNGAMEVDVLPVQEDRDIFSAVHPETKLKRTMDLILNSNLSKKNVAKTGLKPSANEGSPKGWNDLPSLNLEDELPSPSRLSLKAAGSACKWNILSSPDMSPDDVTKEHGDNFLSQSAHGKPVTTGVFEYEVRECGRGRSPTEGPVEFVNETRTHPKRRIEFDYPTSTKHLKGAHSIKEEVYLQPSILDKYRHEDKSELLHPLGRHSMQPNGGQTPFKRAPGRFRETCYEKYVRGRRGNKDRNLRAYYSQQRQQYGEDDTSAQITGLCPSWTPQDKQSKKVLSFVRSGNDRQSRLVWQSSIDRT